MLLLPKLTIVIIAIVSNIDIDINMNNIWINENVNAGVAASLLLSSAPMSLVSRFETDF